VTGTRSALMFVVSESEHATANAGVVPIRVVSARPITMLVSFFIYRSVDP